MPYTNFQDYCGQDRKNAREVDFCQQVLRQIIEEACEDRSQGLPEPNSRAAIVKHRHRLGFPPLELIRTH
jgi:hypothetical protein